MTTKTTTVRTVEVGNLYVGDRFLVPGDILQTVTGFVFFDASPGLVGVITDFRPAGVVLRTTDLVQVVG